MSSHQLTENEIFALVREIETLGLSQSQKSAVEALMAHICESHTAATIAHANSVERYQLLSEKVSSLSDSAVETIDYLCSKIEMLKIELSKYEHDDNQTIH
ncbi:hypothetical protein [Shewanella sp. MBTL60-007]|uniref:hypothetical protein n=1 Tax=Shewanella sp. MBTL60-007 TaxID=2815911 RepID=UPI001BBC9C93|nr:hypothetical protein [Shewanella sp. MBTL60-007]GIU20992.1 hypothetical protein TUM3792_21330 [Shewanella sp. MBTL60-007]